MQAVGPSIPVGIKLCKAEVGPTSGPTRCLSHLLPRARGQAVAVEHPGPRVDAAGGPQNRGAGDVPGVDPHLRYVWAYRDHL
jgi:hypothetical protein